MPKSFFQTLKVAKQVASGADEPHDFTPPANAKVDLDIFVAKAPGTPDSVVCVVRDWLGAGEKILWSSKQDTNDKPNETYTGFDGIEKIALVCSNGEVNPIVMLGKAIFRVRPQNA